MSSVTRAARPGVVDAAYWLWMLATALLVLYGLLAVTSSSAAVAERFPDATAHRVDSLVTLLRLSGALALIAGLAVGLLAGPVRSGHRRLRPVLATVGIVAALVSLAAVATGLSVPVLLPVPIVLLVAAVLLYRPTAREWYAR